MNEQQFKDWRRDLLAKGWTEDAQGNLSKRNPVGGVDRIEPKPDPVSALDQKPVARKSRARGVVICVTIISLRKRQLDSDNCVSAQKQLRDAIAKSIGLDDGDKRFRWEYEQCVTSGRTGTIVRICLK